MLDKTAGLADAQPFFKREYLQVVRPARLGAAKRPGFASVGSGSGARIGAAQGFEVRLLRCF